MWPVLLLCVQIDALLDDLLLLLEDLELLGVVGARHLGAVAADARRGGGVQRVDAAIAVDGVWGLAALRALLLRRGLLLSCRGVGGCQGCQRSQ